MRIVINTRWRRLEWGAVIAAFILTLLSLALLYSLELNQSSPDFSLLERQAFAALLGVVFFLVFIFFDFRYLKDVAYGAYGAGLVLLGAVLILGVTRHGTTGWFSFFGVTFQPVELFKLLFIIALAKFLSQRGEISRMRSILLTALFIIPPAFLIYLQPDVGSLIVLLITWFCMLFLMKMRPVHVVLLAVAGILLFVASWIFLLKPYQKDRLITFVRPVSQDEGAGYHVRQSKIAIGSGWIWGRGFGLGTQSSLNFLPEQETDFIFAAIAESLGFLGSGLVIILYTFFLWRIVRLAESVDDEFAVILLIGIFVWFGFQGFANIAMNMGLAPVFGVPLPFLSYGGSALLVSFMALGIIESVAVYSRRELSE